jgi:hypothetical protein
LPTERTRALCAEIKVAYFGDSEESQRLLAQLTLDAIEILSDEEWDALYADLLGGQANDSER